MGLIIQVAPFSCFFILELEYYKQLGEFLNVTLKKSYPEACCGTDFASFTRSDNITVSADGYLIWTSLGKADKKIWVTYDRCGVTRGRHISLKIYQCRMGSDKNKCTGWSDWSAWGHCDKDCDYGLKNRTRTCSGECELGKELCNREPCKGNM